MIEVVEAPESKKELLWDMYQEYAQELAEYDGEKRRRGSYHYPYFDLYWEEDKRTPFLIFCDHEPIGFCLFQDTGLTYQIAEFYVRPLHRRRGFGCCAIEKIKEHCRELGRHTTLAANIYVNNIPAIEFWKKAGFKDTGRRTRVKDLRMIESEADLHEVPQEQQQAQG